MKNIRKVQIIIGFIAISFLAGCSNNHLTKETRWASASNVSNISIQDDFTSLPSGVALSNGVIKASHVFEDKNVLALGKSWMGAFPSSDSAEKTTYNTQTGFLTYKLESGKSGLYLKDTTLNMSLGITTNGLYNNAYFSSSMGKANVTVEVSEDNLIYENVYDFLNDKSLYQDDKNPYTASNLNVGLTEHYKDTKTIIYSDYVNHGFVTYNLSLDLSNYCSECLFIRINLIHCEPNEIKSSASTLEPSDIAERLYKVSLSSKLTTTPLTEAGYYIYDNFRNNSQKMGNLAGEFHNLKTEGSIAHGLIPSYQWGADVYADNGYILYKIPVNGNGIFSTFKSLAMKMNYYLTGNNNSNIVIEGGFEADNYITICDVKSEFGVSSNSKLMSLDLSKYVNGSESINGKSAIDSETLYIKINVLHKAGKFSLGALGVKLFDLTFKGKMNFIMNPTISLKYGEDDIGLRFSTLIEKSVLDGLKNNGYSLKCMTLIMPYDYLSYYGELNYENVFGDNRIYSSNKEDGKTTIIMSYAEETSFSSNFDTFYAVLSNLKETNIARNFIARGVIEVEKNNVKKYLFANYSNGSSYENMVNMYDAAKQIISETSDYYLKAQLQEKYIDKVGEVVAKYTAIDVYFYKDGTTYMVTKRTNYNLVGTEVSIELDPQSSGTVLTDGVQMGGKFYKYFDELSSSVGVTHYSKISGTVQANGKLELIRYYQEVEA